MPSDAAKNARMWEMKKRSSSLRRLFQSGTSLERSISSAVQNEAIAFLYMRQIYEEIG